MSGHSHWAGIKHDKGIADAKRGMAFSKLARMISIAAKKGKDHSINSELRTAIEKAREINMPTENIERAIKRGAGELEGAKLEEFIFEVFGPGKVAIIIEGITDNKNRTLNDVKKILAQGGGKLAATGAVQWLFERKGVITISPPSNQGSFNKESFELKVIEAGAEDMFWHEELLDVHTKVESLEAVKKKIEDQGINIESSSLDWVPKETISVDEKDKAVCQKLFEDLDENEDVQEIYSNLAS
jgi:YebC/PmpR family DNA-binding regulatory protein